MSEPETVPYIYARDIYKGGDYVGPEGNTRCALGHICNTFRAYSVLRERACTVLEHLLKEKYNYFRHIHLWNDNPDTSKREIAKLLNQTFEKMGYTETVYEEIEE